MPTLSSVPEESTAKTKYDWSTPYDEWLIPILNRYRYGGAIECRAIPSEIQIYIERELEKKEKEARVDTIEAITKPLVGAADKSELIKAFISDLEAYKEQIEKE